MKYFFLTWLILTFAGPLWLLLTKQVDLKSDYRTANRDSAHLAPNPKMESGAVIQVYAARAFNWRGIFASHCWMAVKAKNATTYTVYQVTAWQFPTLSISQDIPDRNWYDQRPNLLLDLRGDKAESLIPKIEEAAKNYPDAKRYVLWPGPNSNSFPAYVARQIPELGLALPSDAVGKDLLPKGSFFARAPSGTGYQVSFYGVAGFMLAKKEGLEINLLGMVYGVRFSPFRILLPGIS